MTSYSLCIKAMFCDKPLPMPPTGGKVVLIRPGITFGNCFNDFKNKPLPSCPNLMLSKKDSTWELNTNPKIIYSYNFKLQTSDDAIHIDNAFFNLTFSAPNVLQLPSDTKVILIKYIVYLHGLEI